MKATFNVTSHKQHLAFAALLLCSLVAFWASIGNVIRLALQDERYSHVLLILPITVFLFYAKGRATFLNTSFDRTRGLSLVLLGVAVYAAAMLVPDGPANDVRLSATICALVIVWMGAFLLCYGPKAFRLALFPLLFLLLMVPLPDAVVDKAVIALQHGSAATTLFLFRLLGVPVLAEGVNLTLPGVQIEVAKECSGIRSSESLVIASILAGYFLLQSAWSRLWLVLLTVPITILKNAVRITTLSWLAVYVDPAFLRGNLHRYGGLPFSTIAVALMVFLLYVFRRWETWRRKAVGQRPNALLIEKSSTGRAGIREVHNV
ncbi:MAG: exosortase/archaeosortase family protein [Bryobacteraceae bacterium]